MRKPSVRAQITIVGLFAILLANNNMFYDFVAGTDHALIHEMRLVSKPNFYKYQENLDVVVLKHIPIGASVNVAMEICLKNGFKTYGLKSVGKQTRTYHPGMEEYFICSQQEIRWYLITTDEYRVIVYLKNNQVESVEGRFFAETFV